MDNCKRSFDNVYAQSKKSKMSSSDSIKLKLAILKLTRELHKIRKEIKSTQKAEKKTVIFKAPIEEVFESVETLPESSDDGFEIVVKTKKNRRSRAKSRKSSRLRPRAQN